MPVGAGSLQRAAAKAFDAAEEPKKERAKSAAVKETAAKKRTAPVEREEQTTSRADTVYHLTEELPYYLL